MLPISSCKENYKPRSKSITNERRVFQTSAYNTPFNLCDKFEKCQTLGNQNSGARKLMVQLLCIPGQSFSDNRNQCIRDKIVPIWPLEKDVFTTIIFLKNIPRTKKEHRERREAQKRKQDLFSEHKSKEGCSFYFKLEFCIFLPSYLHAPVPQRTKFSSAVLKAFLIFCC